MSLLLSTVVSNSPILFSVRVQWPFPARSGAALVTQGHLLCQQWSLWWMGSCKHIWLLTCCVRCVRGACSVKDRAENLMIVDLLRNDLGRVSALGSVGVPSLMAVESYAFVHQLVSTVRSRLHPSVSPVAAVRAAFPGGSMTGAPKIRSMQLLDEIEGCARGPYSGVLGYFSLSQTFSFNIVIRSAVLSKDTISVGAGGAVIALSNPTAEFREMRLKARSVEKALALLQPGGLGSTLPGRASLMERSAVGPERS